MSRISSSQKANVFIRNVNILKATVPPGAGPDVPAPKRLLSTEEEGGEAAKKSPVRLKRVQLGPEKMDLPATRWVAKSYLPLAEVAVEELETKVQKFSRSHA